MNNTLSTVLLVLIAAAVTFLLRAFPFLVFGGERKMPKGFQAVADKMPPAIIAVLLIYCIKGDLIAMDQSLLLSVGALAATILVHLWKRNTLLSVFAGTFVYMLLIRVIH